MNSIIFINRIISEQKSPRHIRKIYLKNILRANKSKCVIRLGMSIHLAHLRDLGKYGNYLKILSLYGTLVERDLSANQWIDFHVWRIITRNTA